MAGLELVPNEDAPDTLLVVDPGAGRLVGEVIPSDVHPGKWRAAVADPRNGYSFVRVSSSGEELVDLPQVGTETFTSPYAAKSAIERNRIL
ncbi:hypothetical protein CLV63_116169 [Murinocardiopsis flavida]|uniref:Uncharacterized protein n=1 Tax=Murinocardiopsis flavida TaxID=645275 RepID=A0A2P8D981_9ACTN|nr:hypothetical protein [Murinocardiopsis flavida]PSK93762.1 hypothetical protein CLV63_116169 [Murinocardiopsis flavida]